MREKIKILTVGAGAIGAYFTGRLAESGAAEVATVVRSDYEAVRERGFQITSIGGDFTFKPSQVCRTAADYQGRADYIFLCTKALPQTDPAALLGPAVHPGSVIVLIQNGFNIEPPIKAAFPEQQLLSAVAYIGVTRRSAGAIAHQGGGSLAIGVWPPPEHAATTPELERLLTAFRSCRGLECAGSADIVRNRLEKLLWNVPFNALSVLAGCVGTRAMVENAELLALARALMYEICAVSEKLGRPLTEAQVQHNIDYTIHFPDYKTSMLVDFEAHRMLEHEAILGNLLREARRLRVDTPRLATIYALLASADAQNRRAGTGAENAPIPHP